MGIFSDILDQAEKVSSGAWDTAKDVGTFTKNFATDEDYRNETPILGPAMKLAEQVGIVPGETSFESAFKATKNDGLGAGFGKVNDPLGTGGDLAGDVYTGISHTTDPSKAAIGTIDYYRAKTFNKIGLEDDEDWDGIRSAYHEGGGRGVWEQEIVGDQNWLVRGLLDAGVDPLTYIPIVGWAGKTAKGTQILARASEATSGLGKAGSVINAAGKGAAFPFRVAGKVDEALGEPFSIAGRGAKKVGQKVGFNGKVSQVSRAMGEKTKVKIENLRQFTPNERVNVVVNNLAGPLYEFLKNTPDATSRYVNDIPANMKQGVDLATNQLSGMGVIATPPVSPAAKGEELTNIVSQTEGMARGSGPYKYVTQVRNMAYPKWIQDDILAPGYAKKVQVTITNGKRKVTVRPAKKVKNLVRSNQNAKDFFSGSESDKADVVASMLFDRAQPQGPWYELQNAVTGYNAAGEQFKAQAPDHLYDRFDEFYRAATQPEDYLPETYTNEERDAITAVRNLLNRHHAATGDTINPDYLISPGINQLFETGMSDGMQLASRNEFRAAWDQEFHSVWGENFATDDMVSEYDRLYDAGLKRIMDKLVEATGLGPADITDSMMNEASGRQRLVSLLDRVGDTIDPSDTEVKAVMAAFDSPRDYGMFMKFLDSMNPGGPQVDNTVDEAFKTFAAWKSGDTEYLQKIGITPEMLDDMKMGIDSSLAGLDLPVAEQMPPVVTSPSQPMDSVVGLPIDNQAQVRRPIFPPEDRVDSMVKSVWSKIKQRVAGDYSDVTEDAVRNSKAYRDAKNDVVIELGKEDPSVHYVNWMTTDAQDPLFSTVINDGRGDVSVGEYASIRRNRLWEARRQLSKRGISWDKNIDLATARGLTDDGNMKGMISSLHKAGLTPDATDEEIFAEVMHTVETTLRKNKEEEFGVIKVDKSGKKVKPKESMYDLARGAWKEIALTSPKYLLANLTTNTMDAIITGHFRWGNPLDLWRIASALAHDEKIDLVKGSRMYEFMQDIGPTKLNEVNMVSTKNAVATDKVHGSNTRELLNKIPGAGKALSNLAVLPEKTLRFGQALDQYARIGVFMDTFDRTWYEDAPQNLAKLDAIWETSSAAKALPSKPDLMMIRDPAKAYAYFRQLGIEEDQSKQMARVLAGAKNKAIKEATKEQDRIYLSYKKTNLDAKIEKFIPFHYWASRKVRFYAEEAARNPIILGTYVRAQEGIDRMQDDPGMNARQKGFLRLLGGPGGFTLLMNPDALMGVIRASALDSSYTPEGETEVGHVVRRMKENGIGLFPWMDGILNLMGTYGDTFEPDLLGIRHRALVGAAVNWMRGETGNGPGEPFYANLSLDAREVVSRWTSSFAPDWLSRPVEVGASGSIGSATIDRAIESVIIHNNPGMTNGELLDIMNNPDSPEYMEAFKEASRAGVIGQILTFTSPTSMKMRESGQDVRAAEMSLIREEAKKLGMDAEDVGPYALGDAQFRANYLKKTGKEFQNTSWADAKMKQDMVRAATPESRNMIFMDNEYKNIGGPRGQAVYKQYYDIVHGGQVAPGFNYRIENSTPEQLQMYAGQWLQRTGNAPIMEEVVSLQRSFKNTHPAYAQFKQWEQQMNTVKTAYGGSLRVYRDEVTKANPNAARYFADQAANIQRQNLDPIEAAARLDYATTSPAAYLAINGISASTVFSPRVDPVNGSAFGGLVPPTGEVNSGYGSTMQDQLQQGMPSQVAGSASASGIQPFGIPTQETIPEQTSVPQYDWMQALRRFQ